MALLCQAITSFRVLLNTADAAGLPVASVMAASVPLVLVMGTVSTLTAFWMLRKEMKSSNRQQQTIGLEQPSAELPLAPESHSSIEAHTMPLRLRKAFALIIPLLFALDVALMFVLNLQGGDATALIGGTAVVILIAVSLAAHRYNGSEETTHYLIEGFQFGFKVFGPVIPIAAFFILETQLLPNYLQILFLKAHTGSLMILALRWRVLCL